jgi:flagellar biosynthetic protein FliR
MRGDLVLSLATLLGFLLTLVRVTGIFVFIPLPGLSGVVHPVRAIFALGITVALFPLWPHVTAEPNPGLLLVWILSEAALGLGIGLAVAFIAESFAMGAQVLGLQAGYSFASTIDPNTEADSTVLVIFSQLAAGLLFFTTGLDRQVLRVFARSLELFPAGSFVLSRGAAAELVLMGTTIFSTGLRLALPLITVLLMVDISLALLGRVNAQLQLLSLAFPIKMMLGLAILGWLALLFPTLYRASAGQALNAVGKLLTH